MLRSVWLIALLASFLVAPGGCGSEEPVVVVTLLGLSGDIVGVRVQATLNGAPAKNVEEFREGFGPATVQYPFAVRLPAGSQGRVELALSTFTQDGCYVSHDLHNAVDVTPGEVVPLTVTLTRLPQTQCPLEITKISKGPGRVRWKVPGLDCSGDKCSCAAAACTPEFAMGSAVTVIADGENQTALLGWDGACGGASDCPLTLNSAQKLSARFMPVLKITKTGADAANTAGLVRSLFVNPPPIGTYPGLKDLYCEQNPSTPGGGDPAKPCSIGVPPGTTVKVWLPNVAPPCFIGLGGACQGLSCQLKVDTTATANETTEISAEFPLCKYEYLAAGTINSLWVNQDFVWVGSGGRPATGPAPAITGVHLYNRRQASWISGNNGFTDVGAVWADSINGDAWYSGATSNSYYIVRISKDGARQVTYFSVDPSGRASSFWGKNPDEMWMLPYNGARIIKFGNAGPIDSFVFPGPPMRGIAKANATELWAVGESGTIMRGVGMNWAMTPSGVSKMLNAVWALDSTTAWAVGEGGTILRWNGTDWKPDTSPVTTDLSSIWGTSANNVWAVGSAGAILWWNGKQWNPIVTASHNYNRVHGSDDKNFWVTDSEGGVTAFTR